MPDFVPYLLIVALGLLVWYLFYRLDRLQARVDPSPAQAARAYVAPEPMEPAAGGWLFRSWCTLRQVLRRWVWALLFVPGVLSYPLQMDALVRYMLRQVPKGDYAQALDAAYAKLVDPLLFYSKVSIAVGMFFLINWLAWAALNLAMPVLPDWAKGWYKQPRADYGVRSGFKGTFLGDGVSDTARLALFLWALTVELGVGYGSVSAAFNIQ